MHSNYKVDRIIKNISLSAMFVVLYVVINRFIAINIAAFGSPAFIRITISTIVLIIASIVIGPIYGMAVGVVSDIVGALLFPIGAFFPGYTLTYAMAGLLPGLVFYFSKKFKIKDVFFFLLNLFIEGLLHIGAIVYILIEQSIPTSSKTQFHLSWPLIVVAVVLLLISFATIVWVGYREIKTKKKKSFYSVSKIWFSYLLIEIVCYFFLNSFWTMILIGTPFSILFVLKIAKSFFTIPIHVILVMPLVRVLEKRGVIQEEPMIDSTKLKEIKKKRITKRVDLDKK